MNYWAKRIDDLLILGSQETTKQLQKEYQRAYNQIERKILRVYDQITIDGVPSISELYKFNRYYELMAAINLQLEKLGNKEQKLILQKLTELYQTTAKLTDGQIGASFSQINKEAVEQIVTQVWCADGKSWSDRIWAHKGELREELSKGLIDMVTQGKAPDKVSKYIQQRFGVGLSDANRIVRTEMNNVQTQAAKDRYQQAGFTRYEILATLDSRTSEICREQDGKIYQFIDYQPGITAPPFHPNCRTTILPKE